MTRIEFFYDVVSPYSFLAFETMFKQSWAKYIVLRPALLGGVMNASGNSPPGLIPAKWEWIQKDLQRNFSLLSPSEEIQVNVPPKFPTNTISAMRLLLVLQREKEGLLVEASRNLWTKYWVKGEDISLDGPQMEMLCEIGISVEESKRLMENRSLEVIKQALKKNTQDLIDQGGFGMPSFIVFKDGQSPQLFFGSDRMHHIAEYMREGVVSKL